MAVRRALLVFFLLLPLAAPEVATAAFAQRTAAGALDVAGGSEQNTVTIALGNGAYTISDAAGMTEGNGCSAVDATTATCTAAPVTSLTADLGDGNDKFSSTAPTPAKVLGGPGNDDLTGGSGADDLVGGPANDTLHGGGGDDKLTGESSAGDTATGQNTMDGGNGNDTIDGGGGPDTITGGGNDDTARGGAGADTVDGGDGNDTVSGGDGNDALQGGPGNDVVGLPTDADGTPRERGSDSLDGGAGDDVLQPGSGPGSAAADDDVLAGGAGVDEVTYASRTTPVTVTVDGVANDGVAGERDNVQSDLERVTGGTAADQLRGGPAAETLSGGPGGDTVDGGGGADTTDGGEGNDTVSGGAGSDVVTGGPGDDQLDGSVSGLVGVDEGDVVAGGSGNDRVAGGDGNDLLDGGPGADEVSGGPGVDGTSYASATTAVTVTLDGKPGDGQRSEGDNVEPDVENLGGWSGQDTFTGNAAANGMDAGGGEDFIDGGAGPDSMTGGSGFDVIRARDGVADAVDCGDSRDFAIVDTKDHVDKSCERIDSGLVKRPKRGRLLLLRPLGGSAEFGLRGMHRTVPLKDRLGVPFNATVDATRSSVRLTTAALGARTQSAVFSGGAFLVKQRLSRSGQTDVTLTGGDLTSCGTPVAASGRVAAGPASRTVLRRLFGRAHGHFRSRGRFSTATVRGTAWEVVDRCDGTLTKVISGTVVVRDRVRHRTITLRGGQHYLAPSGNR